MDISSRLIAANAGCACVLLIYFHLPAQSLALKTILFLVSVVSMKIVLDMVGKCIRSANGKPHSSVEAFKCFAKWNYGTWIVGLAEAIVRAAYADVFRSIITMGVMLAWIVGYAVSEAIGVCHTNTKNYRCGTIGFETMQWLKLIAAFLVGS